jgi:hypothetical protein
VGRFWRYDAASLMPKTPIKLPESFKFRLSVEDRRRFEAAAAKLSLSLSAFLRVAAIEKIERDKERSGRGVERSR